MKKLLVDGFTTKIACPPGTFRVVVCPSGVDVPTSTLRYLSACLRTLRRAVGTQRPDACYADRGYDHDKYRKQVREAGIKPIIARRASNRIPGWAGTAGSLSRVSPYCTGSVGPASEGKSATTSTKPYSGRRGMPPLNLQEGAAVRRDSRLLAEPKQAEPPAPEFP